MATGVPAMLTAGLPARGSEVSEPTELTAGNEGTVLTYLETHATSVKTPPYTHIHHFLKIL